MPCATPAWRTTSTRRGLTLLVALAAAVALTACSAGSEPAAGTTAAATSNAPESSASSAASSSVTTAAASETATDSAVVEVAVSVRDGKVRPRSHRVKVPQGAQVRLVVTSDVDDAVHVHGFEVEETLEAGRPTTVDLVADQSGVFEVETHESGLELLQLEVR